MNRQRYYRSFWLTIEKQNRSDLVITLVNNLRAMMPRLGTRKIYHILEASLQSLHVGRDKLFSILKANGMLIKSSCAKSPDFEQINKKRSLILKTTLVNLVYPTAKYNGNIAEIDWNTSNDNVLKRYTYDYYADNKLKFEHYSELWATAPPKQLS